MKLPAEINEITLNKSHSLSGIYPPLGFIEFEEGNDGAGDGFGLYWELGKEGEYPIICKLNHEEYGLTAEFSDLKSFLAVYEVDPQVLGGNGDLNDETFFIWPLLKAELHAKHGRITEAIEKLKISVNLFGELSDSWALLSEQLTKTGEVKDAELAAINAIKANWVFGFPSKRAIKNFEAIDPKGVFKDDPLVKNKDGLIRAVSFNARAFVDFEKLAEIIEEYKVLNDNHSYLKLKQNYVFLMYLQNKETKARFKFDREQWRDEFINECAILIPERKIRIDL